MEFIIFLFLAIVAALGAGYCLVRPQYAFVAVILMFPAEQLLQSYNPQLILRFNWLVNFITAVIVMFAIASAFFRKSDMTRGMWNGVTISLIALFTYVIAATAWTPALSSAQFFLKAGIPYWIFFLVLSPMLLRRTEDFSRIIIPTMVAGIVVSIMIFASPRGHFQYGRFVVDLGYLIGYGELTSNPLALADIGGTIAILAILYRAEQRRPVILLIRIVAIASGLALALASGSRGQVVFSVLCALAFYPLLSDRRNWGQIFTLGLSGVFAVGMLFVFYTLLLDPSGSARWTGASLEDGFFVRANLALSMMESYVGDAKAWIFGLGTSAFNFYYPIREHANWYPHNIFVEALSEYGLIGFGLLSIACFITIVWGRNLFQVTRDDVRLRSTTLTLLSLTVFHMLLAFKQGHLIGPPFVLTLMLVIPKLAKTEIWLVEQQAIWAGENPDESAEGDEDPEAVFGQMS